MDSLDLKEMIIEDYEEVISLWKRTEGMGLSSADTKDSIKRYLERNSELSLVGRIKGSIVSAILCGHDGRRGYIHHLAVDPKHRHNGIGKRMVEECLKRLKKQGIEKCHLFVFKENKEGIEFWKKTGWIQRNDLDIMSKSIS